MCCVECACVWLVSKRSVPMMIRGNSLSSTINSCNTLMFPLIFGDRSKASQCLLTCP